MDLLESLKHSLSHQDKLRKEAELYLLDCANKNFQLLLVNLCDILNDQNSETSIRQISGIFMKNLISNMIEYKGKWSQIDKEIRNQIKEKIYSNISNSNNTINKVSSLVLTGKNLIYFSHRNMYDRFQKQ